MKRFFALLMALCLVTATPMAVSATEVEVEPVEASSRAMTYNQVWIDAGDYANGHFTVENPHTFIAHTYGTIKIESENPNAEVTVVISNGYSTIKTFEYVGPGDGELYFDSDSNASQYVIYYFVNSTNKTNGIRVNCWLY